MSDHNQNPPPKDTAHQEASGGGEGTRSEARVLSIQSHTVHGYVGNKSAVFPLQTLGIEVDIINSVQFSNHTGYPTWKGEGLDGDQLWTLVEGLRENDLINHTHLLTGYMRSPTLLRRVLQTLDLLREENPNVVYVCDPVMGDNGRLYVPADLVPIYRDEVIPKSSVLTPNQFEAELLTGIPIIDEPSALAALAALHALGPDCVVITSTAYGDPGFINLLASRRRKGGGGGSSSGGGNGGLAGQVAGGAGGGAAGAAVGAAGEERYKIVIPRLAASFTGTGDLLASLLLAWLHITDDLATAIEHATSTVQEVLRRTLEHSQRRGAADIGVGDDSDAAGGGGDGARERRAKKARLGELRLIQSRDSIVCPFVPPALKALPL